jgi:cobaltochelatase CobS
MTTTSTLKKISTMFPVTITEDLKNGKGDEASFECIELAATDPLLAFIPTIDDTDVFPTAELSSVLIALDSRFNKPLLIWGYHGSGKTTLAEQVCARTGRPAITVQHDVGTEGSDVVGQWVLKGKETVFEYGPLARAMRDGLVYIADEYDFALPNVLSIYQGVLNGGALFIKNAPAEMAIVRPHKNFRFIATGNTNGAGDEIGLYQGTQLQNAANYSRFGITIKLDYQKADVEKRIINAKIPGLPANHTDYLITFAAKVREAFANKTITNTLSTRELVNICMLAVLKAKGSKLNWTYATEVGFINRMPEVDRKAIKDIVQKVFA